MRQQVRLIVVACSILLHLGLTSAQPVSASYVLYNGKIFTADPDQPWTEALAIHGDRIAATGDRDEILSLADSATHRIDLQGHVVIPGINDAHVHTSSSIDNYFIHTNSFDPAFSEILDSLAVLSNRMPPGTWLMGSVGSAVFDHPEATRFRLDEITPNHPVMLVGWTGHGRLLNSAALDQLGISDDETDHFGGWYEREAGILTGLMHGYAGFRASGDLTRPPDSASVSQFESFAQRAVRFGITSVQQMGYPYAVEKTLRVLEKAEIQIRWRIIHFPLNLLTLQEVTKVRTQATNPLPHITVSGMKWIMDGTPEERMMVLREPYADRPSWRGRPYIAEDAMREAITATLKSRQQLIVHAVGDQTVETLLSLLEEAADSAVWQQHRPRIEHGDGLMPDLYRRARKLGVIVVQNPSHFTIRDLLQRRLGKERLARFQMMKSLHEAGIAIALGSDGPLNPYLNIMFAVTHPANPPEALTREQAVRAYTRGSAFAEFEDHEKGTLTPGMLADLAVLSQDIFTVSAEELPHTVSMLTMVGGRIVYQTDELKASN